MSKWDKLISRIYSLSKDMRFSELRKILESCGYMRFSELRKILESCGYTMNAPRGGSSHYTFRKPGKPPITIPKNEPIKRVYVEMVRKVVEESMDEND